MCKNPQWVVFILTQLRFEIWKKKKMEWIRGALLGKGSFGTVNLAMASASSSQELHHMPLIMAVKSSTLSQSSSLQREKEILTQLQGCPQILRCFGNDLTVENGNTIYNLFLEYVSGGTLADRVKDFGGRLPEPDVRRYTRSMLQCLNYIHGKGYVHCDIKLPNILVSADDESVKISDFGLAKRVGIKEEVDEFCLRGTPLYMSPESIAQSEYEPPTDIWSLGCIIAEMIAGKPAWRCRADADVGALLFRIGFGSELPEIPSELSEQGKDFLSKCFVRDPTKRWTAEALLNHPFVADETVRGEVVAEKTFLSPRSAFDFPQWGSLQSSSPSLCSSPSSPMCIISSSNSPWNRIQRLATGQKPMCIISSSNSPWNRIQRLATRQKPNWSTGKDDWITAREAESSVLVSERNDSLLVLEEMLMRTENREENFTSSTSSSVGASISFFPVQLSDSGSVTDQEGGIIHASNFMLEFAGRRRDEILEQFETRSSNSSDFKKIIRGLNFELLDCNCIYSSILNEYKQRILH